MRQRHLVLAGAVSAALLGIYGTPAQAAKTERILKYSPVLFDKSIYLDGGVMGEANILDPGAAALSGPRATGTWIPTPLDLTANPPADPRFGLWNTASNWSGGVPNGATDAAIFGENGDVGGITAFLTTNITLQTITQSNEAGAEIRTKSGTPAVTITMGTGGLTYNHNQLTFALSHGENKFFTTGEVLNAHITGSGALIKNGPGDLWLTETSDYTGGTVVNGGRLVVVGGSISTINGGSFGTGGNSQFSEAVLGSTSGSLTLNGGALYMRQDLAGGSFYTFDRVINVGSLGGDIQFDPQASPDFNGNIVGTGPLRLGDGGDSHFLVPMSYSGDTIIDDYNFHTLTLDGAMVNSPNIRNFGRLDIINSLSFSAVDRLGDNAHHYLYGSEIFMGGSSVMDVTETTGTITLQNGMNVLTLDPKGDTQGTTLAIAALDRQNKATLFIRGQNLGTTSTSVPHSKITVANAPTLVGGLVPYAVGATKDDPTMVTSVGIGIGVPVTVDADGLRPLRQSEMTTSIAAGGNAFLTTSQAGSGTVNSLTLSNPTGVQGSGTITITGSSDLHVTSGVIIENIRGNLIQSNIDFGAAEGVIHTLSDSAVGHPDLGGTLPRTSATPPAAADGLTISGVIKGTGGLTKGGSGDLILTGANTYTGTTAVTNGRLVISADVTAGVAGPLGMDSSPILLSVSGNGGADYQGVETALMNGSLGTITINRDILVAGQTQALYSAKLLGAGSTSYTRINGNIDLGSTTTQDVSGNSVNLTFDYGTYEVNGVISGWGRISDEGDATTIILNGNNTFTGGVEMGPLRGNSNIYNPLVAAVYELNHDHALGTGRVDVLGPTILRSTAGPRTIGNDFLIMNDTVAIRGTNPFTFTGGWDLNLTTLSMDVGSLSAATFSGTVKNGRLNKFGTGTLVLNAANALSSVLQIGSAGNATLAPASGGVVVARHPQALSNGGGVNNIVIILPNSTLMLDGTNGNINASNKEVQADGSGSLGLGAINNASGNNALGILELQKFTSVGTFLPNVTTVNVAGSSTLSIGQVWDFSGPTIPAPFPQTNPPTPALRNIGSATLVKDGAGVLKVDGIYNTKLVAGALPIQGGATLSAVVSKTKDAIGGLTVNNGTLQITSGGTANSAAKTTVVKSLTIGATGHLDLSNNSMVIDYTGAVGTLVGDVRQHLANGRLLTTAATPAGTKLGYADNGALSTPFTSFSGVTVDTSTLLVKYTYAGDANLDGQVDITDLAALATAWQTNGVWVNGDFDYSGFIDITDLAALATNWQAGVGAPLAMSFDQALAGVGLGNMVVPEPAGLAALAGLALLGKRRRK